SGLQAQATHHDHAAPAADRARHRRARGLSQIETARREAPGRRGSSAAGAQRISPARTKYIIAVRMKPPQNVPLSVASIFLPGPVVPLSALALAGAMTMAGRRGAATLKA